MGVSPIGIALGAANPGLMPLAYTNAFGDNPRRFGGGGPPPEHDDNVDVGGLAAIVMIVFVILMVFVGVATSKQAKTRREWEVACAAKGGEIRQFYRERKCVRRGVFIDTDAPVVAPTTTQDPTRAPDITGRRIAQEPVR